ncbi:CACTA en-spm transposon protein [Cucumis melo var. makuwa]|uniref:CACTA en-spm transposon protein n=1 Tax=Cucumis melo var. makuwa TaxID=1194695 RepID=A0A5A7ULE6_CUCMM|nr:CACTA en-spm transposon protein [Cucumis melo var. makuwa]
MRPSSEVRSYSGCIVDGVQFHMVEHDSQHTTINSGAMVVVKTVISLLSLTVSSNLFLEFDDAFNNVGLSSMGDNSYGSQPTRTLRKRQHSRNLELERYAQKIHYLKWADVPPEYMEVFKAVYKSNQGPTRLLERNSLTTIVAGPSLSYNDSLSFTKQLGHQINRVELFRETHANRSGQFVSQEAADAHNKMLELQSQPTLQGFQPLSEEEICETILDRRSSYSKGQKILVEASNPSLGKRVANLRLHIRKKCTLERLAH